MSLSILMDDFKKTAMRAKDMVAFRSFESYRLEIH
jgi:hypothetical protein